ncbi:ATP-binding protein [Nocardioides caldifontis]|uniref:ATP-binding protein n=1 Tax=Nocardioides caldifontis TaxID=2588938 RepID=UPI00193AB9A3|nr:LuxR family transcriptional regulator [Nocardioides caldifontis]
MDILERDLELARLRSCIAGAAEGSGAGTAVSGEPGAGKSALVETACAEVVGMRVLRGACDPLGTPRPLGPFRDLARQPGFELLAGPGERSLAELCEIVYDALAQEPTVLVVEDLHWADRASVEVLRFVARRIEAMPLALFVTYRGDELGQHSARALLGDFAVLDRLESWGLAPLSVDAVARLLAGTPLDPVQVHALTGGNPFFVTEVAKDPDRPLPSSVRDAVLARTADMAPDDFELLQLVATAPERLDDRVLPVLGVDLATLGRLDATGLLARTDRGLAFRHELARLAVESTIPAGGAAQLHARLLATLEKVDPGNSAALTHHAVRAGDPERAVRYAEASADEAARAGAHTEAVEFLRTALASLPSGQLRERASLLLRLGFEQYMTDELESAIANVTATFPLWSQVGDAAGLASAHDTVAVLQYYNGKRTQAEKHADHAVEIVSGERGLEYASALATRAFLAFQRSEFDTATTLLAEAARIARQAEDDAVALRSRIFGAFTELSLGQETARERLVDDIQEALAADLDELASTGFSNLADLDVEHRRLADAQAVLERSIAHTVERGVPICSYWQTGVRARMRLLQGRWQASSEDAGHVLSQSGMPLANLWPHLVLGLVDLRRHGSDHGHVDAAWKVAEGLDEPLRRLAVLSALAERAWLTGQHDERLTTLAPELMRSTGATPAGAWGAGEMAVWLQRLGLLDGPPAVVAPPYRMVLDGDHVGAAEWWRSAGAVYDEALALATSPDPEHRLRALERLDQLQAAAVADRLRLEMRRQGVPSVPPRPRSSTAANPSGLTNRQLDVAKLVARGLTNAEIAERLYISPKTADHHVSAVLTKLGVPNRRQVVLVAQEIGL